MCNAVPVMSPVLDSVELEIRGTDSTGQPKKILGFELGQYAPFAQTDA